MEQTDKKRILLVDDSAENIRILLEVLKGEYQVVAAKDGAKALALAQQQPAPDIILLDVLMPQMDGYEVCRRLKQDPQTREIPVIFVTALAEDANEELGFTVGAVDYITKPINPAIVRARVRTHLSLQSAQLQLAEQNKELIQAAELREDVERIMQHDLKGPLTTIISMPGLLLKKENITAQQKDVLQLIRDAGYLMLGMINSSLNLYKMEVGSYLFHPQEIDLLTVLRKVCAECRELCAAYEVSLQLLLGSTPAADDARFPVMAEELLSHTMLSNLLKNAVEAAPAGSTVTVSLVREMDKAVIRIQNEGEVPAGIRDRFFEKYVTSGKEDGTGLGTYSAYMAVRTQGGSIALDSSRPGETTIEVRLQGA